MSIICAIFVKTIYGCAIRKTMQYDQQKLFRDNNVRGSMYLPLAYRNDYIF